MNKLDLTKNDGKFGKLTVISEVEERSEYGGVQWICLCECGREAIVEGGRLTAGRVLMCPACSSELPQGGVVNKTYPKVRSNLSVDDLLKEIKNKKRVYVTEDGVFNREIHINRRKKLRVGEDDGPVKYSNSCGLLF